MTVSDDEIFEQVAALPRPDAAYGVTRRIRTAALAELGSSPRAEATPRPEAAGLWTRVVEPVLVVASLVAYLTWTTTTLSALHTASAAADFGERDSSGP
jgi:hypothetical protein